MKKCFVFLIVAFMLTGCAAVTTVDRSGFLSGDSYFDVRNVTVRDRTGTEMHHLVLIKDGEIVDRATASGRGIVAGMTDGTLPALIHTAGFVGGMAAADFGDYNNTNTTTGSSAEGGKGGNAFAKGGNASAKGGTAISGSFSNASAKSTSISSAFSKSSSKATGGGWVPPGQGKK